jgi:hypothetical protein
MACKPTLGRAPSSSKSADSSPTQLFERRKPSMPRAAHTFSRRIWPRSCRQLPTKAQQAQALASAIDSIHTLHHQTFPAVQRLVVPYPARPDHAAILRRRLNDALARVSIFRRSTRKAAKAAAVLATRMECEEVEAASQAQYAAVQQQIDELWQRLITNDVDVVLAVLNHAFRNSGAHAAPLAVWDAEAQLALLAPELAALPERHPTTTAAGNLSQEVHQG